MSFARTDEQRMLANQLAIALSRETAVWDAIVVGQGLDLLGVGVDEGGLGTDARDAAVVAEAFGLGNAGLPWAEHWADLLNVGNRSDAAALLHCAELVGLCTTMMCDTASFMRERRQFGKPIADFQALRHRMADMAMLLEQARAMTDVAIDAFDGGGHFERVVCAARVVCDDAARAIGEGAVQIHGAMGLTEELRLGGYFRRSRELMQRGGGARAYLQRYAA